MKIVVIQLCGLVLASLLLCTISIESELLFNACENDSKVASYGDHLLFEYTLSDSQGNIFHETPVNGQLSHILLTSDSDIEESSVSSALVGMCEGSKKKLTIDTTNTKTVLEPILIPASHDKNDKIIYATVNVRHITTSEEYQIFTALRDKNLTKSVQLIQNHTGINVFDEWGQTPLMIATINNYLFVVSALFNTVRPPVDVNMTKNNGFAAIHYAVSLKGTEVLKFLLKRKADPNVAIRETGSKGNTPLHLACLLEKPAHAELLLQNGANPLSINEHGARPFSMVPRDAVTSVKLKFKKLFEDAINSGNAQVQMSGGSRML